MKQNAMDIMVFVEKKTMLIEYISLTIINVVFLRAIIINGAK